MIDDRLQSFDFLRGVAILGVIVFHVFIFFGPNIKGISALAGLGVYGVQLFFIVSALTMSLMWRRRIGEDWPIIKFYIRRFFRIAPPFWLAVVGYLILNGTEASEWSPNGVGLRQILMTSLFLHGFFPDTINAVVPGGWSIAVEMTFYVVFPFIASRNLSTNTLAIVAFAVYLVNIGLLEPFFRMIFSDQPTNVLSIFLYYQFFNQAPIFLIGMALFKVVMRDGQRPRVTAVILFILCWLGLAFLLKEVLLVHSSPFFWLTVSTLAMFTFICLSNNVSFAPIDQLGKASYSTYLIHFAIIQLVEFLFRTLSVNMHSVEGFVVALTLTIVLCFVCAAVLRATLEGWSSKLGRWVIRKSFATPPMMNAQIS